ncbi:hypothetical protein C3432_14180 [Citrobacter amalonaticus]|uniref:Uncharacterized protein n=1 Tax=Citrobacter amalonaticus TaxID=35703 RepID=A0A2S4RWF8_CITAM|nr:hypothetical protein [Citrobacter amalonaticus]POT56557.1 hypothetical protein C3432_14180 [Citrobacter amalonaticus]POT75082.1 hypothetical protein C3436_14650 [Citrobacter amalonaticus]POU64611.1 hypothetical protein C3430_15670 [Citrobacter amalonaticus]POV04447.1 hypothetical protein C3424_14990 [Citrobacter amalonaticus]
MMKIKILTGGAIALIVILAGTAMGLWYTNKINPKLDCTGSVVWEINHEVFKGDIAYQMHNNQGVVTVAGELKTAEAKGYKISRVIYFTWHKIRNNYIISSSRLMRFPSDKLQDKAGDGALPAIYLSNNASLSFQIKRYREGWAFTTVGAPSLLCRNVE